MGNSDAKRVHVHVSGKVQGVFYRESTREEAERLGLFGWVKNLPDGRVEAVFEGETSAVDEMLRWCEHDPGHASVESVEATEEEVRGETRFEVL